MSVIYRDVEVLENIVTQQQGTRNPLKLMALQAQFVNLKQKIDADIYPITRLCHPWTYVPPSIS